MAGEDTEITLGAGKLLGLFFLLAAVCGVFFAIGYSLGKTSAREQALNDRGAESVQTASAQSLSSDVGKPSAAVQGKMESQPTAEEKPADSSPDLTFYKAVKQSGADTAPPAAEQEKGGNAAGEKPPVAPERPSTDAVAKRTDLPAVATTPGGEYLVQIAAVSHEEDAAALVSALRKKSYNASLVNNPASRDKLYHVVIGPFATKGDADAMKVKLTSEGYNPIVKR